MAAPNNPPKWALTFAPKFGKTFRKLDRPIAARVAAALEELQALDDPRVRCRPLTGQLAGLWRHRVGDWRILLDIHNSELVILALEVGHRSEIYES